MSNIVEYKDLLAFHPGYYIAETIEDMGMTQGEFATRMGTTPKTLSKLVNGQANITNDLAQKLSTMLGTSPDVWLNLQAAYDNKLIEIQKAKDLDAQKEIIDQIDYSFFRTVAGLPMVHSWKEKLLQLCKYLMVSDLRILAQPDFMVNFRTVVSKVETKNIINSKAWIQTAINVSKNVETRPFNAGLLKSHLPEIRKMTTQPPEAFLPKLRSIFSDCGVVFVVLPHLKNSGVNGAVKWVRADRVVLAMNNRGLHADKFWFSLFHEIRHVLQQKTKTVFVSSTLKEMADMNQRLEKDADAFASDYLIPPAALKEFSPALYTSDKEIIEFADSIGIHPGIVAGRLQHDGILSPNRCSQLKESYDSSFFLPEQINRESPT